MYLVPASLLSLRLFSWFALPWLFLVVCVAFTCCAELCCAVQVYCFGSCIAYLVVIGNSFNTVLTEFNVGGPLGAMRSSAFIQFSYFSFFDRRFHHRFVHYHGRHCFPAFVAQRCFWFVSSTWLCPIAL